MSNRMPMGYIFPRRIKSIINGDTNPFGSKYYMNGSTPEEKDKFRDETDLKLKSKAEKEKILQETRHPWTCPVCNKLMRHKLDSKYYNRRDMCMDCTIKAETHLKTIGLYAEYEKQVSLRNYKAYLLDIKEQAIEFITNLKSETKIVNHDGSFDTLVQDISTVKEFMEKELEDLNNKLKDVDDVDLSISAEQALNINLKDIVNKLNLTEKLNG